MGRGGGEVEHRVALIVKNADPSEVFQIFLLKQTRPGNEIAGGEKDSDIWDLASAPLLRTAAAGKVGGGCDETLDEERFAKAIGNVEFNLDCLGLKGFAISDAVEKIQTCIHPTGGGPCKSWRYWKYVEEPAYGPGPAVHTIVFIIEILRNDASFSVNGEEGKAYEEAMESLPEAVREGSDAGRPGKEDDDRGDVMLGCAAADGEWFDPLEAYNLLVGSDSKQKRIGPLATLAFSSHFPSDLSFKYNLCVQGQEYPPGIFIAPMESATMLPFSKTNLVVFAPTGPLPKLAIDTGAAKAFGDALICDPGCHPVAAHAQLAKVVNELPRKLLVFLTHHHFDHIDGLPTVRKQNPQAIIIAHQKTLQRMGKGEFLHTSDQSVDGWMPVMITALVTFMKPSYQAYYGMGAATTGFNCIAVEGGSKLLIAGQELEIISAPGHTDGHLALLHRMTGTVLVGDHCVGQGSSVLDPSSGANMQDYLDTCNRLLDLGPKVIVPAHGKPNLWPTNMLHTYIKHREEREAKVLDAILGGARTAYEVVAEAYKDTPAAFWPAALKNVKLHVEHLDYLHKLPPDFDLEEFERSAKIPFYLRCFPSAAQYALRRRARFGTPLAGGLSLVVLAGAVACLWKKKK